MCIVHGMLVCLFNCNLVACNRNPGTLYSMLDWLFPNHHHIINHWIDLDWLTLTYYILTTTYYCTIRPFVLTSTFSTLANLFGRLTVDSWITESMSMSQWVKSQRSNHGQRPTSEPSACQPSKASTSMCSMRSCAGTTRAGLVSNVFTGLRTSSREAVKPTHV